jgi:Family of unknown function (DUF6335)
MMNQVGGEPNRELDARPESLVVTDMDPAELEKVVAIDAPIWEGITDRAMDLDLAEVDAEAAIGGTTTTPDWNGVDDLAATAGIEIPNGDILNTNEILEQRDIDRWELNPQSAEDHQKHQK